MSAYTWTRTILVMRLIPVLITLWIWHLHGTQRNLDIHIPVFMLNTNILVTDYCMLYAQAPVMFTILTESVTVKLI